MLYDPACGLHTMSDNQLSALFHDIDAKSLRRDDLCLVCRIYKVSAHLAEHSGGGVSSPSSVGSGGNGNNGNGFPEFSAVRTFNDLSSSLGTGTAGSDDTSKPSEDGRAVLLPYAVAVYPLRPFTIENASHEVGWVGLYYVLRVGLGWGWVGLYCVVRVGLGWVELGWGWVELFVGFLPLLLCFVYPKP